MRVPKCCYFSASFEKEFLRHDLTLASDPEAGQWMNQRIIEDYQKAEAAILEITGMENLCGHVPVFQKSVKLRNPYSDVLNLLQIVDSD